jgi:hypothetical protein
MPLILDNAEQTRLSGNTSFIFQDDTDIVERPKPSLEVTTSAAFQEQNTAGSLFASALTGTMGQLPYWMDSRAESDPNVNPLDFLSKEDLEKFAQQDQLDYFAVANSQEAVDGIKKDLDRKNENNKILSEAGASGIAMQFVAGGTDPLFYAPLLNQAKIVRSAGKGIDVARTAVSFAKTGAIATTAQEAILQSTQQGRTLEESAMNIGIDTFFSGLIGGGYGKFREVVDAPKFQELTEGFANDLENGMSVVPKMPEGSVGAMKTDQLTLDDLTISTATTRGLAKLMATDKFVARSEGALRGEGVTFDPLSTPDVRVMLNSESVKARATVLELTDFNLELNGHQNGKLTNPRSLKDDLAKDQAMMSAGTNKTVDQQFDAYVKRLRSEGVKTKEKILRSQFNQEIHLTNHRGGESDIPEVKEAANFVKTNVYDFARDTFNSVKIAAGAEGPLLPEAPLDAKGYAPVQYNNYMVGKNSGRFVEHMEEQLTRDVQKAIDEVPELKAEIKKLRKEGESIRGKERDLRKSQARELYDPLEIRALARQMANKIEGRNWENGMTLSDFDMSGTFKNAGVASAMKSRKIQIYDDIYEKLVREGFVESDVKNVVERYVGTFMRDLRITQRLGDVKGDIVKRDIAAEYDVKIELLENARREAEAAGDTKRLKQIVKEDKRLKKNRDATLSDIAGMINIVRGEYNKADASAIGNIKNYNAMRLMGSVLESSIPDVARLGFSQASAPIIGEALMRQVKNVLFNKKKWKASIDQANDFQIATDLYQANTRMAAISDTEGQVASSQSLTGRIGTATNKFFQLTGMNHWNSMLESVASQTYTSGFYKRLKEYSSGSMDTKSAKQFETDLRKGGMTVDQAKIIKDKWDKFGTKTGSLDNANIGTWNVSTSAELDAVDAFKSMVRREVETMIVTPHLDRSLFGSKGIGSMVMQFASFGQASFKRATLLYAQRVSKNPADFGAHIAMVSQIAMGGMVAYMKIYLAGLAGSKIYDQAKGWGAERWVTEAVDRSGITGNMMDIYNKLVQPLASQTPLGEALGMDPLTRFQQRGFVDRLAGPTFGLGQEAFNALPALTKPLVGEAPKESEVMSLKRMVPYNNYLGVKYLIDGGIREMDLPK